MKVLLTTTLTLPTAQILFRALAVLGAILMTRFAAAQPSSATSPSALNPTSSSVEATPERPTAQLGSTNLGVTGTWLATNVPPFVAWVFRLTQDGTNVTGTVQQILGGPSTPLVAVQHGTITGTNLTFSVFSPNGNALVRFEGVLSTDEIVFAREGGAARGSGLYGAGGVRHFTARRQTARILPQPIAQPWQTLEQWLALYDRANNAQELLAAEIDLGAVLQQYGGDAARWIGTLAEQGDPRVFSYVPRSIDGGNARLPRDAVATMLAHLGTNAALAEPGLARALRQIRNGEPFDLQKFQRLASLIGNTGLNSSAMEDLVAVVPGTNPIIAPTLVVYPLQTLVRDGAPEGRERLSKFLTHPDAQVRVAAALTIGSSFEVTKESAAIIDDWLRAPEAMPDPRGQPRVNWLLDLKGDTTVFVPTLFAIPIDPRLTSVGRIIGGMGEQALPIITQLLTDEGLQKRAAAAQALDRYLQLRGYDASTWPIVVRLIVRVSEAAPDVAALILSRYLDPVRSSPEIFLLVRKLSQAEPPGARGNRGAATRLLQQLGPPPALMQ